MSSRVREHQGLPVWVWPVAALGALVIVVPLAAMTLRVDWPGFWALVTAESSLDALWLSLRTAALSTLIVLLLGVPMALVLARTRFPGQRLLRAIVLLPLVLPPVVGGLALLYTFGRMGLIGQWLEQGGIQVVYTTTAVVIAQVFVSLPFLVLSLEGALRVAGSGHEQIAATLGAKPSRVLTRVTLPLLLPAVATGAVLAFARALGEFGATLAVAGSLQGVTRTLPLQVYLVRETDPNQAVALSLLLVVVAMLIMLVAYRPVRGSGGAA